MKEKRLTGLSVPLGSLRADGGSAIWGRYTALQKVVDLAERAGLELIQLLPINDPGTGASPYSCLTATGLDPIYIDPLEIEGWKMVTSSAREDFERAIKEAEGGRKFTLDEARGLQEKALRAVFQVKAGTTKRNEHDQELVENDWVRAYCAFKVLKARHGQAHYKTWESNLRQGTKELISEVWRDKKEECEYYLFLECEGERQLKEATDYAKKHGVRIKGDIPVLLNDDSVDLWARGENFCLDFVAGSPPEEGDPMGQRWGFPTYNWRGNKKGVIDWWKERLAVNEQYFSAYRLDHVLGFFRIWAIPSRDDSARLGHTDPYVPITREELHRAGFSDERIRWLSQPHVPTGVIENITWNHGTATAIMEKFANRIGQEELWLFKPEIKGDKDFFEADLKSLTQGDADVRIKKLLSDYWCDRALIEITPDNFVPIWTYAKTTSYKSLNWEEKNTLESLINNAENAQNKLWEAQASEILSNLTQSVKMTPCGEDLGAELPCLPTVLQNNGILALRVYRWCRNWKDKPRAPYTSVENLTELAVVTSSVHDSSTLRGWWEEDKDGVRLFVETYAKDFGINPNDGGAIDRIAFSPYTKEDAKAILSVLARAKCLWAIHPIQDFLGLVDTYNPKNAQDERINVPGTVNDHNWTYRLPVTLDLLIHDEKLIAAIKEITDLRKF